TAATHPAHGLGRPLRDPRRRQPSPPRLPRLRRDRRRRLRGRRGTLPRRRHRPRFRRRRGRGHLLGPVPRLLQSPVVCTTEVSTPPLTCFSLKGNAVSVEHPPIAEANTEPTESGCPVATGRLRHPLQGGGNHEWWPEQLNLKVLAQNPAEGNPLGSDFDYKAAFEALDLAAVKRDIAEVLTTSQDWWPADFGNYGPLMIRMAWHRSEEHTSELQS